MDMMIGKMFLLALFVTCLNFKELFDDRTCREEVRSSYSQRFLLLM